MAGAFHRHGIGHIVLASEPPPPGNAIPIAYQRQFRDGPCNQFDDAYRPYARLPSMTQFDRDTAYVQTALAWHHPLADPRTSKSLNIKPCSVPVQAVTEVPAVALWQSSFNMGLRPAPRLGHA